MELPNLQRWRRLAGTIQPEAFKNWIEDNPLDRTQPGAATSQQTGTPNKGPNHWPPPPTGAQYPMAHLGPEHFDSESVRILHELYRALKPWPEAKHAVRTRLRQLIDGLVPDNSAA